MDICPNNQGHFSNITQDFCPAQCRSMINAVQIQTRLDDLEGRLPAKVKDTLRKSRDRGTLPSLGTLIEAAKSKGTTVAYLIGEVDDPAPTPSRLASHEAHRGLVTKASAAPAIKEGIDPSVTVSFDLQNADELIVSLPHREALWHRDQMARACDAIADYLASQPSPSSATS